MTINEAISHCLEVAEKAGDCKCAEDHRQLAEWLRDYQKIKIEEKWIPCHPSELPKDRIIWVTHISDYGYRWVDTVFWDMTEWSNKVSDVVAYMEYKEPESYNSGES